MRPLCHHALIAVAFVACFALPTPRASGQDSGTIALDGLQVIHPCTLEAVTLKGEARFSTSVEVDADGNVFTKMHFSLHSVTATSTVAPLGGTPAKYVSNETSNETTNLRLDGPDTQQATRSWQFIRCAETGGVACCGDDWHLHITFHVTETNGRWTATVTKLSAECR